MLRRLLLLTMLLVLPIAAHAQSSVIIKGQKPDGSTNNIVQLDQYGRLLPGLSPYRLESTSLFNSTIPISSNTASVVKTITPTYAQDISKLTVLMSWAAADSDSVAMEVFVVGKLTGNAADGADYLIDMNPATKRLDGVLVGNNRPLFVNLQANAGADSTALVWAMATTLPPYGAGVTLAPPSNVPNYGLIYSSGSAFSVCPRGGYPPGFVYYSFWVVNLSLTRVVTGATLMCIVRDN